jgi:DeoR family fructose operon transcriptional repressor
MDRMNFDLLFLATNAIHEDGTLTTPNEDEARMKELMVENASRVVLVADGSKLDNRSFVTFAHLDDVDVFVTDSPLGGDRLERFEAANVDVIVGANE